MVEKTYFLTKVIEQFIKKERKIQLNIAKN